jgi:hypothetical protein
MVGRNNRRVWGWRYIEKGMNILDHGYSIESPVLFAGECDALLGTLEKATRTGRAGMRHLMSHRAVRELANDERLLRIARLALGELRFHSGQPFLQSLKRLTGLSLGIRIRLCRSRPGSTTRNGFRGR